MDRHTAELNAYMARIDANSKRQQKIDELADQIKDELLSGEYDPRSFGAILDALNETTGSLADAITKAAQIRDTAELGELVMRAADRFWEKLAMEEAQAQAEEMLS